MLQIVIYNKLIFWEEYTPLPRPSHHRLIIAKILLSGQHLPPIIVITIVVIVIIITVIRSSSPFASSLLLHGIIALVNQTTKHQQFKLNDYPFRQNHQNHQPPSRDALSLQQLVQSADGAEGKQDNQAECKQIQPNLPRSEVICVSFRALLV